MAEPLRHAGASTRSQRCLSEVRHAWTDLLESVAGVMPHAASEPNDVTEGAAIAANFRKVRRLVKSMTLSIFLRVSVDSA